VSEKKAKQIAKELADIGSLSKKELAERLPEYQRYLNTKDSLITLGAKLKMLASEDELEKAIELLQRTSRELVSPSEVTIAPEVREFVEQVNGWFRFDEVCRYVGVGMYGRSDRKNVSRVLSRMVDEGVIERHKHRNGFFRKVEKELMPMNWRDANTASMDIKYPLDIHEFFETYPKNIIVFAGSPDAGKTALFLNLAAMNMDKYQINYFNSEMSEQEFRKRVEMFQDLSLDDWKINVYERSTNFHDVINPTAINIIDYMDLGDEIYKVGRMIRDIHETLTSGIAIIGLQKPRDRDIGYGKELGLQIPRLYISMSYFKSKPISVAEVIKCKNRRGGQNMIGKILYYKLYHGTQFVPQGVWHYKYDDPMDKEIFSKKNRIFS